MKNRGICNLKISLILIIPFSMSLPANATTKGHSKEIVIESASLNTSKNEIGNRLKQIGLASHSFAEKFTVISRHLYYNGKILSYDKKNPIAKKDYIVNKQPVYQCELNTTKFTDQFSMKNCKPISH